MTKYACISRDIYPARIDRCGEKNQCQIKEGIVFAIDDIAIDEGSPEKLKVSAYENYAKDRLGKPQYRRMRISLERLARTIALIETSWQRAGRHHALAELENVLIRQHEVERDAENIEDVFLRGYIYERLDVVAATRRFLAEEVRWDIESSKKTWE
ncbi:MAG: hypothetical protein WCE94_12095 [Candidatus Methanoperedens sp.]